MTLTDPVEKLNLVGPVYAKRLEKLEIKTIENLLYHLPSRYDDFSIISPISHIQPGETLTIRAKIDKFDNSYTKNGKKLQKAIVSDSSGTMELIWFNQPYLEKTLKINETYNFSGKIDWFINKKVIVSPEYEIFRGENDLNQNSNIHTARLVPVYPETYGVSSKWLRSRINFALNTLMSQVQEFIPDEIIKKEGLLSETEALKQIHFPLNIQSSRDSLRRLAFDELFLIQLATLLRKKQWEQKITRKNINIDQNKIQKFINSLSFKLTGAQERCVNEILTDISKEKPMNRLLEGDVGSGKTVVAAIAAYACFLNNLQILIMAPTEILANQHFRTFKSLFDHLNIPVELITGSRKILATDNKKQITEKNNSAIQQFNNGNPKIIVGTHSLLYQELDQDKVGLVIVDEQHRFGVQQRQLISQKGKSPHFLTMTATPIPRSIALTLFGDLDLSVIDEMPKGRIVIKTWVVPKEKRLKAYEWIRGRIKDTPEQAFIICPLIEESESLQDVKAVKKEFETLSKNIFPDLRLVLLHGKIKSKEKDQILNDFKEGKYDILVSTPVVEVGIDIPNATIMLVEGADRFGLAQLHQLRGRVGRSDMQSYCFLFTENQNPNVTGRLKSLEKTNIGMELAEIDLKMRGAGDVFGTKQHGFFNLKAASYSDLELIQKTRKYAENFVNSQFAVPLRSSAATERRGDNLTIGQFGDSPLNLKLEKYKIRDISN